MKGTRFVGLDVHAASIAVAIAESNGAVRSLGTIPHEADAARQLVRKLAPLATRRVCYEAGPCGLHPLLATHSAGRRLHRRRAELLRPRPPHCHVSAGPADRTETLDRSFHIRTPAVQEFSAIRSVRVAAGLPRGAPKVVDELIDGTRSILEQRAYIENRVFEVAQRLRSSSHT
jgi:hypothetical protein